jgi:two-component system chemotaxis response regulator CheB
VNRAVAQVPRRSTGPDPVALEQAPIRIMIVDDSQIARAVLSRMISMHRDLEVAATAGNAAEALDALKSVRVDIVLLDVEMPGTSGLEALPEVLRQGDGARVMIVSSAAEDGAEATVRALALGATDTLPKPGAGTFGGRFSETLAARLRALGRAPGRRTPALPRAAASAEPAPMALRAMPDAPLGCLALGASTGGLHALSEFLRALPREIGAPILLTQHLPASFMPFFARQIEAASGRLTRIAEHGLPLQPEQILIAPGDAHLELARDGSRALVRLGHEPVSSGCRPSVDPMLWSLGEAYGESGLGVVFSGMGRDGLVGSARLVNSGGAVIVQDQHSSAVWGMPRAVAEAGLASAVLAPADLARRVEARAQGAFE